MAADVCGAYVRTAAELGADRSTVIVTAPGRQGSLGGRADGQPSPRRPACRFASCTADERRPPRLRRRSRAGRRGAAGGRRRRRRRRRIDRDRRRNAVARCRLDPVGRHRLAPPDPRTSPRRSADRAPDHAPRGDAVRGALAAHAPSRPGRRVRRRRQRARCREDRRPPLRSRGSRRGDGDPLLPTCREGRARLRDRAHSAPRRFLPERFSSPRRGRVLATRFELGRGGLREGAALGSSAAQEVVRAA